MYAGSDCKVPKTIVGWHGGFEYNERITFCSGGQIVHAVASYLPAGPVQKAQFLCAKIE